MQLKEGTLLQGGKYKIESVLGQGGFGITYLAEQTVLDRKVAIKEFFMKDICVRDAATSHVSVPSEGGKDLVGKFRVKFVKEAQTIAAFEHPHIVRVHDIFEENGTACYVMEYHNCGSLADQVKQRGSLPEAEAVRYIREVADALDYLHKNQINHLDVKPDNILLNKMGGTVLIDFGISKHYDEDGKATTTTPVGISHGYAPLEQYKKKGVSSFSPATDIYSLGATLYKLLTGTTPPEAGDIITDGLPPLPHNISPSVCYAIERAMQPNRNERPQTISEFQALLDEQPAIPVDNETTILATDVEVAAMENVEAAPDPQSRPTSLPKRTPVIASTPASKKEIATPAPTPAPAPKKRGCLLWIMLLLLIAAGGAIWLLLQEKEPEKNAAPAVEIPAAVEEHTNGSIQAFTVNGVTFNMVMVEGGTFTMGATPEQGGDAESDEKPTHQVTLDSYMIGETEVTQELWEAVMGSNPSYFEGNDQRPVEQVSWEDCQSFIKELNLLTGRTFRLPTEAEWEYAARGGSKSKDYKYSGSNEIDNVAWYGDNSGDKDSGKNGNHTTHPVATKAANELGIYDMSGNVYEWCSDWYGSYSSAHQTNPTGPSSGSYRVPRGGCWHADARNCRVSSRSGGSPGSRGSSRGLRLVLVP